MDEFTLVVTNTQQVFMGILLLTYIILFVTSDLNTLKETLFKKDKVYFICIFSTLAFGLFYMFFSEWGFEGLFFSIEFTLLIILSIIHPKYAVGFIVYLLLSRPWETTDNQLMESMPRDISYLVILSLMAHKIIKKKFYFKFNLGTFLLISFSAWVFFSAVFSAHSGLAVNKFGEIFSKAFILFILIQNTIDKVEDTLTIKMALMLSILEKGFISFYKSYLLEVPTIGEATERLVSVGILGNSNDIAAIFVLVAPFVLFYCLNLKLRPFNWLIAIISFGFVSALIWQTQSRGAVLALVMSLGSWLVIKINLKNKRTLAIGLIFSLITGLGLIKLFNRSAADVEGSTNNRIIFWKAGVNMAVRNPVFGVGYWGFNRNLERYALDGNLGSEGKKMTAHSSWVLALSETGFLGLFFFLGLWVYAFYRSWLLRKTDPEYFMAIVGYGICITFLSHTYLLFPYILLSLVITHSHLDDVKLNDEVEFEVLDIPNKKLGTLL
jgi:putative inorganic carbon (HCO3(-)) transporter